MIKSTQHWILALLIGLLAACGTDQDDINNQANQYLKSAQQLSSQGQLRAALVQAKNVIQISPDSAQGYVQIASIYNQIGYYSEVEKLLNNKLALMPEVSYELAMAHYQRKKYRSALEVLAVSKVDQDQRVGLLKSLCYLQLNDIKEFDSEVATMAAISDTNGYTLFAQAKAAQINRQLDVAEALLLQITSASELHVQALTSLAEIYIEESKFNQAEKKLTDALSLTLNGDILTVERAKILSTLVQMLVQTGRSGDAYTYQKILATASPQLDLMQSRFDEAVALYAKGDVDAAKNALLALHQSFPNNSNVTTLLGVIAFQTGNDEEAERYLSDVIDPETATTGLIQASSMLKARNNKIDEAILLLKDSVAAQPKNSQLLATYGLALLQKNPLDKEGVMALEKSVAMASSQQRLRLAIAERHYKLNEKEQGLAQLEAAYRNSPLDVIIVKTYFNQLAIDIDSKQVAAELNQLKQKYPHEHKVVLIEAWWLFKQKRYDDAVSMISAKLNGISIQEKLDSWLLLSDIYLHQGKKDSAQKVLEDYLRLAPQATVIYPTWMRLVENKVSTAVTFLEELQQVDESAWQPHFYLALLQARSQQWDQVDSSLSIVLQKNPQEAIRKEAIKLYNTRGFELFKSGDLQQSQKIFIKTLGIDPEDRTALYYYVQIALKSNQLAQAKKILEPVEKHKKLAIHHFLEGLISEYEQNDKGALNSFRTAWMMDAFDLYAEKLYGIYQSSSDQKLLMELIAEWHDRLPQSPQGLLLFAMLQQQEGREKEAADSYEKLLALQPKHLVAMNNLAWLYAKTNPVRAEELALAANKLSPNSIDVMDTYGWVLLNNKKFLQAKEILTKALAAAPDNKSIQSHLLAAEQALSAASSK